MEYKIEFTPFAKKQLKKLGNNDIKIILKQIRKRLTNHPKNAGNYLRGELKGYLKLKFSKYRVVYSVHKEMVTVEIVACGLRKNIYEQFKKFLEK